MHLIHAVAARFKFYFDFMVRFLKAFNSVGVVLVVNGRTQKLTLLNFIETKVANSTTTRSTLQTFLYIFCLILEIQKRMETGLSRIIYHLLSSLESVKMKLNFVASDVAQGARFAVLHTHKTYLARLTFGEVSSIRLCSLWIATSILHPYLSDLSFISPPAD